MIIKIIPETPEEQARMQEITYESVKEFFVIGNRVDEDGDLHDFHEWQGSVRYLVGSLAYYSNMIHDARKNTQPVPKIQAMPKNGMIKNATVMPVSQNIQLINTENLNAENVNLADQENQQEVLDTPNEEKTLEEIAVIMREQDARRAALAEMQEDEQTPEARAKKIGLRIIQ